MASVVARQERQELKLFQFAAEKPKELPLTTAKPYRCKSFSIIGWTGPKVKGVLVRRRVRDFPARTAP